MQNHKQQRHKPNARAESAAPTELLFFCVRVYPGFCSCLWHSRHPGLCRSVVPTALTPAPPNKSESKRKQPHHPINPTTNASNTTTQPIRQQTQVTPPPNQSDNKRKQRHQTIIRMINRKLDQFAMSPERAILLQSPGREPWVKSQSTYIEPQRGGTNPRQMLASKVPLLRSSYFFVYVFTQGSVRAFGTLATLGFAGVSCLRHSRQHHQPIRQQAQTTTPNNKRKSPGRKSLGFERKCRPT